MKTQSLVMAGLLLLSTSLQAQDIKMSLNPDYLPKDVDKVRAASMLKQLKQHRQKQMGRSQKLRQLLMEDVSKVTEPVRKKLLQTANSSPRLKGDFKNYMAESEQASKLEGKKQQLAIRSLQQKYRPLFKQLFKLAKINERQVQEEVELVVADSEMAADEEQRGYYLTVEWNEFLTLLIQWLQNQQQEQEPEQESLLITLEPPFPNIQRSESITGDVDIDTDRADYVVKETAMFATGSSSLGGLGHFFRMPESFSSANLTAALPNLSYNLIAAGFLGAAGAYANSSVDILSDNEIVCEQRFDHGLMLAIAFWASSDSGTDTFNISCDFEPPAQDREIVLSFYSTAGAWGAAIGAATSRVNVSPRDLVLILEP